MSNIYKRTSIRKFKDTPVEKDKLIDCIKAGMQAPSAWNQQAWEFIIVDDRMLLDELSTVSPGAKMLKDTPQAIIVVMKDDAKSMMMRQIDCAAATENILLRATDLGLGACWIGVTNFEERVNKVSSILNIENGEPFCQIAIGYPDEVKAQVSRFDASKIFYNQHGKK